jgi:DNA-binding MarR family transcriptional regulator
MNHGVGYQFKIIDEKIKVRADADLKRHDLTLMQTRVLGFLAEMGGRTTQKEIEDDLQVSHPTVVGLVSRMEQKDFLTTRTDPMDRRNKLVELTEKALEIGRDIDVTVEQHDAELLQGFSEQEVETLKGFLRRINHNLGD